MRTRGWFISRNLRYEEEDPAVEPEAKQNSVSKYFDNLVNLPFVNEGTLQKAA
jgi:hypothetical protein